MAGILGTRSKPISIRQNFKPCLWGHSSFSLLPHSSPSPGPYSQQSPLHPGMDLVVVPMQSCFPSLWLPGEKPGDSMPCRRALGLCPALSLHHSFHPPVSGQLLSHQRWAAGRPARSNSQLSLRAHDLPLTRTNSFLSPPNTWSFSASSRSRAGAGKVSWPPLSLSALLCHFFLLYHCVSSCWWSWPLCSSRRCIRALQHTHPSPSAPCR